MSKQKRKSSHGAMLELWRPPQGAGDPIGCLASTYTFAPELFDEQCLARFLEIESEPNREDLAFLLERESRLGGVYAAVLVDYTRAGVEHSLRWDVLPVRIHAGKQHAKLSLLAWTRHVRIIVASANLTEPGYRSNYEVAAAVDLAPEESCPDVLAGTIAFLRSLLACVPGASERPREIQRAEEFLDQIERQSHGWKGTHRGAAVRQRLVCTLPAVGASHSARSSLEEAVQECRRRGGSPSEARIASPFFDADKETSRVTASLCKLMARGGHRAMCFSVPASKNGTEATVPRLAAPVALLRTPPAYQSTVTVEMLPDLDEDKNRRPWHAKMLGLRSEAYSALMIGSSNFTSAGMGVGQHRNAEANLLTIIDRVAYSRQAGELEGIWPEMEAVADPEAAEWLGSQPDPDEIESSPPLPPGFLLATYRAGDNRQIVLRFDPPLLSNFSDDWHIHAWGQPGPELFSMSQWQAADRPPVREIVWLAVQPPQKLLVCWADHKAFLALNVEDAGKLPPPAELESMSADDMLLILAATDPSAAFRVWTGRRQPPDSVDPDLDTATPIDLDPLRRYDLQAPFLHRIRRRAHILAQLRSNLQRPAYSQQALEWRLRGMVGIEPLANRLVREFANTDANADESLLTLADFLIVLHEVDYDAAEGLSAKGGIRESFPRLPERTGHDTPATDRATSQTSFRGSHALLGTGVGGMLKMNDTYLPPSDLVLGKCLNTRVPESDQRRQRAEVEEILSRLNRQPGVILADEVGMGKTFVALAVAYTVAIRSARGPVIVMVPANLVDKWEQDLKTFGELYLSERRPIRREHAARKALTSPTALRYGVARHSVDLMKLLDDPSRERCHLIFLAQGAMARRQTDKWIRLALIAEALRRHGRGKASRLIQVKAQIHRFLARLLWAVGEERAHDWGDELWQTLLRTAPATWKATYNAAVRDERRQLADDPVPKAVVRALPRIDLKPLAAALEEMPVRARGGDARLSERLDAARRALRAAEEELWKDLLAQARWRSPLLVMDEAHHLKNPGTALARQLQKPESQQDLRTGDGAMARAFDRMLFLTATPFQLGHHELIRVLERFGDVRWESNNGQPEFLQQQLNVLRDVLDESQRAAIRLQQKWSRLQPDDCDHDVNAWWERLLSAPAGLNYRQQAVVEAFHAAKGARDTAQAALRPWIVRHNKGEYWTAPQPQIRRRQRLNGVAIVASGGSGGLPIPPQQLLPFFLAARSAVSPKQDLLGEALCSSFEAFRDTRKTRETAKDELDAEQEQNGAAKAAALAHARWYLDEFDHALAGCSGASHPKVDATVRKVVDLWESGEKVLVFAFYRHTCRALRQHISDRIERRITEIGLQRLLEAGQPGVREELIALLNRIQDRYFDKEGSPGRLAIDAALADIIQPNVSPCNSIPEQQRSTLTAVMRRFLRVHTTLVRCFPVAELDSISPDEAVKRTLDRVDASGLSWRRKLQHFAEFLAKNSTDDDTNPYLDAAKRLQTGKHDVEGEEGDLDEDDEHITGRATLANVRVATGETRRDTRVRLMRAFNTPFFPDVLVCSQVMGEGVDLQRFCRHVIHHDLDWNPSTIEQRTGRIDRLGCKAEGCQSIVVYLPYLAGTADERQYRVMSDREQWFRFVMGQDEVARLIAPETEVTVSLPDAISAQLSFKLGIDDCV